MADAQNLYLVQHAILYPNDCNLKMVDETFQAHYQRVQKIKYISNLIYFFSLDFDKKEKIAKSLLLVADSGLMDDGIRDEESEEEGLLEKLKMNSSLKACKINRQATANFRNDLCQRLFYKSNR